MAVDPPLITGGHSKKIGEIVDGSIRNCQFAFKYEKKWDELTQPWSWPTVRFCDDCKKSVHLCATDDELVDAIKNNRCVAIPKNTEPGLGRRMPPDSTHTLGLPRR